jgi:hypothetical protein
VSALIYLLYRDSPDIEDVSRLINRCSVKHGIEAGKIFFISFLFLFIFCFLPDQQVFHQAWNWYWQDTRGLTRIPDTPPRPPDCKESCLSHRNSKVSAWHLLYKRSIEGTLQNLATIQAVSNELKLYMHTYIHTYIRTCNRI